MVKKRAFCFAALFIIVAMVFFACYQPEKFDAGFNVVIDGTATGSWKPVNSGMQVCNVSITQDLVGYPASILFLNFQGKLNCKVGTTGLDSNTQYLQHDHLFVVDTSNTVKWYYAKQPDWEQMQDPEWSNNGNYISFLAQNRFTNKWNGYIVRMSDKDTVRFNVEGMNETADPYLWIGSVTDTIAATGRNDASFVDSDTVSAFLGTKNVKIAYIKKVRGLQTLFVADYRANQAKPDTIQLSKLSGYEAWDVEAPIISPDGRWVAYQATPDKNTFVFFVQEIRQGAKAYLMGAGGEPHFYSRDDGSTYIIYTDAPGYTVGNLPNIEDGALGRTFKQKVNLYSTGYTEVEKVGSSTVICGKPTKGGMSSDGSFIGTGYANAYIFVTQ